MLAYVNVFESAYTEPFPFRLLTDFRVLKDSSVRVVIQLQIFSNKSCIKNSNWIKIFVETLLKFDYLYYSFIP